MKPIIYLLLRIVDCEKDIVFVLDSSNFKSLDQYQTNLMFVSNVVDRLYGLGSQFAVLSFF